MTENQISYKIRGAIFEVYNHLGPGLLESIYAAALRKELIDKGLKVKSELHLPVYYKGESLGLNYRIDLLVEDKVIVELKSVEYVLGVHHKQVLTYLTLTGLNLGILVNFNSENIGENIFRKVKELME
jgi:GxxExxY protein